MKVTRLLKLLKLTEHPEYHVYTWDGERDKDGRIYRPLKGIFITDHPRFWNTKDKKDE